MAAIVYSKNFVAACLYLSSPNSSILLYLDMEATGSPRSIKSKIKIYQKELSSLSRRPLDL